MNLDDLVTDFSRGEDVSNMFSAEAVENFYVFLKEAGLKDQGTRLVDPDQFFWLDPVYNITRTDLFGVKGENGKWLIKPRFKNGIVFRKASQMGASVWSVAFMIWLCIDLNRPLSIGCFWPYEGELQSFISTRLDPMLRESPKLKAYLNMGVTNNTQAKQIGRSTLYFRHVAGKSAMDAVPMDVTLNDEVRLWEDASGSLQRIEERMGQSDVQLRVLMSTVGLPEDYMEQRWFESNMIKYFTACPNGCCTEITEDPRRSNILHRADELPLTSNLIIAGVVLSDYLPTDMIRRTTPGEAEYVCPHCGASLEDSRVGGYAETCPKADGMFAIEFARTLSKAVTPYKVLEQYLAAEDVKQYMNGWMAKSYLNPEGRLVTEEHWRLARDRGARAELSWNGSHSGCYLGADFRTNEMHVVIGELEPTELNGLIFPGRLAHVEVFQGHHWEDRLEGLLGEFGVAQAIIDYMPDTSGTLAFAKRHPGRVLLADYRDGELIRLPDNRKKSNRKVHPDGREEHKVLLDQAKSLSISLKGLANGHWLIPDGPLRQHTYIDRNNYTLHDFDVLEGLDGRGREGFMQHVMGLATRNVTKDTKAESGEKVTISGVMRQEIYDASGFDPHWAHAFNYMVMASKTNIGGATVLRPSRETLDLVREKRLGMPSSNTSLAQFAQGGLSGVQRAMRKCGDCRHGPASGQANCQWTGMKVAAHEPACNLPIGFKPRT